MLCYVVSRLSYHLPSFLVSHVIILSALRQSVSLCWCSLLLTTMCPLVGLGLGGWCGSGAGAVSWGMAWHGRGFSFFGRLWLPYLISYHVTNCPRLLLFPNMHFLYLPPLLLVQTKQRKLEIVNSQQVDV